MTIESRTPKPGIQKGNNDEMDTDTERTLGQRAERQRNGGHYCNLRRQTRL